MLKHRHRIGIIHMIQAVFAFSLMSACSKALAEHHHISAIEMVFFRSTIGLVLLSPYIWKNRFTLFKLSRHQAIVVFIRCATGFFALVAYFYAIAHLDLSTATLLNYTSPLFIVFFSTLILKEPISWGHYLFTSLAFGGIFLIMQPYFHFQLWPFVIGLLSGIFTAMAYLSLRFLNRSIPQKSLVFYFTIICATFSLPGITLHTRHISSFSTVLLLLGLGLLAYIGQVKVTSSLHKAPASLVSHFGYMNVLFSATWGALFWHEPLTWRFVIGSTIIIGTGIGLGLSYARQNNL